MKTHRKFEHKLPTKRVEKSQNDESVLEVLEEKKEAKKKRKNAPKKVLPSKFSRNVRDKNVKQTQM